MHVTFPLFSYYKGRKSNKKRNDYDLHHPKSHHPEENIDKAFELIWDDDQGQYTPFYISPLWDAVYKAFNIMFGLKDDEIIGNELSWWLDEAPKGEAKYWIDEKEYNVSDVDAFP